MAASLLAGAKAVFFDAVGTILFPDPPASDIYARTAARYGLNRSAAEIRSRFIWAYREEDEVDRASGWVTSEDREAQRWRHIVSHCLDGVSDPEACFHELFLHFAQPQSWRFHPQVAAVVRHLSSEGLRVGIGSNYDARLLAVLQGFPELALKSERVVISAQVGYRKPAPEFFREVIRAARCLPDEILFIGDDRENDYLGAKTAGLRAVLINEKNGSEIQAFGLGEPGDTVQ